MRTGILIIGSLLWDNHHIRDLWRTSRLDLNSRMSVTAPIRYGRRSSSRANTFTMLFDPDHHNGRAVSVPCQEASGDIDDLRGEAEELWAAERKEKVDGSIGAGWGCVGAMFKDESLDVCKQWTAYFRCAGFRSIPPVDQKGLLRIPWPLLTENNRAADFDVILATANKAKPLNVPTAQEIADAWIDQSEGYEQYFFKNVELGICTVDDKLIWARMQKKPKWLEMAQSKYPVAIKVLHGP